MLALARLAPRQEILPLREADACCGGGLFSLEEAALAQRIGQRKRDFIAASGAHRVVTGCPACVLQLRDLLARNRDRTEVRHWTEIYAAALPKPRQDARANSLLHRLPGLLHPLHPGKWRKG